MATYTLAEAQDRLEDLMAQAEAGEEVLIATRDGRLAKMTWCGEDTVRLTDAGRHVDD